MAGITFIKISIDYTTTADILIDALKRKLGDVSFSEYFRKHIYFCAKCPLKFSKKLCYNYWRKEGFECTK